MGVPGEVGIPGCSLCFEKIALATDSLLEAVFRTHVKLAGQRWQWSRSEIMAICSRPVVVAEV